MSLEFIKSTLEGIVEVLEMAIPHAILFPPDCVMQKILETIDLVKEFENSDKILPAKKYWKVVCNCEFLKSTIKIMGWRFDIIKARDMYELGNIVDY